MLGTASAVRRREHLGMSALGDRLRGRPRMLLRAAIRAVEAAFFIVLLIQGLNVMRIQMAELQTSPAGYPAWVVTLALPVGAGLGLLNIARVVRYWRGGSRK